MARGIFSLSLLGVLSSLAMPASAAGQDVPSTPVDERAAARPIESWAELLNTEFKGKAAILNIPSIGIMDAAMVVEATGQHQYADKGNMTKAEIDLTMKVMTEAKKAGQFRAFWKDFNESVNLMASCETVIQSMWSPAVTKVRSMGIACTFQPLKEGYRSWASGFCVSKAVSGPKLDWAYEFVNWYLSG